MREIRALSRLSAVARPPQRVSADWFPDDSMEVVGFELASETVQHLRDIDLIDTPFDVCPAEVLVIDRDDAPANDDLVAKFAASGASVTHERMPGYEDFITESELSSVLPWRILGCIEAWLATPPTRGASAAVMGHAFKGNVVRPVVESDTLTVDDPTAGRLSAQQPTRDRVVEQTVWIDGRYFAVVSTPAGDAPIRRASIVLANTGLVNRIGSGRLHVGMARYWANLGFTVVRVDLPGCGETLSVDPAVATDPIARERSGELREVLTWVRRWTGFEHLTAGGLCSGAFNAFHVAVGGVEVDDLLLLNPGTFYVGEGETSEEEALASAHFLTKGFFNGGKWKMALRDSETRRRGLRSVQSLFRRKAAWGLRAMAVESVRNSARRLGLPVKQKSALARDLEAMVGRGVKILMVFSTGESAARYFHTFGGPAAEALVDGDGLHLVDIDGGDHVFSSPGARQAMFEVTTRFLESRHPEVSEARVDRNAPETRRVSDSRGPLGLSML